MRLQSKGGTQLIRGILQLVEEWEYHFSLAGMAHHSVKAMLAKNIDGPSRDKARDMGDEGDKQQEQASANICLAWLISTASASLWLTCLFYDTICVLWGLE